MDTGNSKLVQTSKTLSHEAFKTVCRGTSASIGKLTYGTLTLPSYYIPVYNVLSGAPYSATLRTPTCSPDTNNLQFNTVLFYF